MKKTLLTAITALTMLASSSALAAEKYILDTKGAHAFIQFKISHLGYSWLLGRFNTFDGEFTIDRDDMSKSSITVNIDPASVDSNHAERDKHLRAEDFLFVDEYPEATFVSTSIEKTGDTTAIVKGNLTLRGVTKEVVIDNASLIGEGKDPWGGYRIGFEGSTSFALKDFGIPKHLGEASETVEIYLSIEGIRK